MIATARGVFGFFDVLAFLAWSGEATGPPFELCGVFRELIELSHQRHSERAGPHVRTSVEVTSSPPGAEAYGRRCRPPNANAREGRNALRGSCQ